mmetsp:Transcript_26684/g.39471  ORF Transcript_26684/g.39471 Transcript_26684/m.39471 type:complete len:1007 (-) Transcript_26684:27-3047(-)
MSLVTFNSDVVIPIFAFQNSLDSIANSCGGLYVKDFQQTTSCFNALCKLLDKILLEDCYDSKTRRMKLGNTLFHERIGSCGGVQFLLACQFTYTIMQKKRRGSMDSNEETNFNAIRLTRGNENRLILVAGRRYLHEYGLRVLRMVVGSGDYSLPPFTIQDKISEDTMQSIRENVSYVIESSSESASIEEPSTSVEESSTSVDNTSSASLENSISEVSGISYDSVPSDGKRASPGSMPITQSPTNQTDQTFSCRSIDVCQVVHHCPVPPKLPMKMEHKSLGFEIVRTKRKTGMDKYMRKLEENKEKSESRKMEDSFLTYQDYVQALNEEKIARKLKLGHIIETDLPHLGKLNKKLSEIDEDAYCSQALSPTSQTIKMNGRMSPDRRCKQSVIWVRNGEEKWVKEAKQQVSSWINGLNTTTFFPFIPTPGGNLEELDSPNSIVLGDAGLSKSLSSASSADLSCKPIFKYQNTTMSSDISFDSALESDVDLLMEEVVVRQIPSQSSKSSFELPRVENGANQGVVTSEIPSQCSQSPLELSCVENIVNQDTDASEIPSQCSKALLELSCVENGANQGAIVKQIPSNCSQLPLELSRVENRVGQGVVASEMPAQCSQSPLELSHVENGANQGAIVKQIPSNCSQLPLELSRVENRVGQGVVASEMPAQCSQSPLELSRVDNRVNKGVIVKKILSHCSQSPLKLSGGVNQGTIRSFSRQWSSRAHLRKQAHLILNNNIGENLNIKAIHRGDSDETEIAINILRGGDCKQEGQIQLATEEGLWNEGHTDGTTNTCGFIHVAEVTKIDQDINSIDNIEQRNAPESYSAHLRKGERRYGLSNSIEHRKAPRPKKDEARYGLSSDSIEQRNAPETCSVQLGKHAARFGLSDSSGSSELERIATIDISRSFGEIQSIDIVDKVEAIGRKKYFHNGKPRKAEALLQTASHISYANSSICTTSIHCDSIDDILITFSSASDSEVVSSSTTSEELHCNSVSDENMIVSHLHAHPSSISFE